MKLILALSSLLMGLLGKNLLKIQNKNNFKRPYGLLTP